MENETPTPTTKAMKAPTHIRGTAKKEWNRIVAELSAAGVINATDLAVLASYCVAYGRWADAEKKVAEAGTVVATKSGNYIQNPYLGVANTAMKLANRYGRELGFSPAARQEIARGGKKPPVSGDTLENLDTGDDEDVEFPPESFPFPQPGA